MLRTHSGADGYNHNYVAIKPNGGPLSLIKGVFFFFFFFFGGGGGGGGGVVI